MPLADFINRLQCDEMPFDNLVVRAKRRNDAFQRIAGKIHLVCNQAAHRLGPRRAGRTKRNEQGLCRRGMAHAVVSVHDPANRRDELSGIKGLHDPARGARIARTRFLLRLSFGGQDQNWAIDMENALPA